MVEDMNFACLIADPKFRSAHDKSSALECKLGRKLLLQILSSENNNFVLESQNAHVGLVHRNGFSASRQSFLCDFDLIFISRHNFISAERVDAVTVRLEVRNILGMGAFHILDLVKVFGKVANEDPLLRSIPDKFADCHKGGDELLVPSECLSVRCRPTAPPSDFASEQ